MKNLTIRKTATTTRNATNRTIIFIGADETKNAGDRDSLKALSMTVLAAPAAGTNYISVKIPSATPAVANDAPIAALPTTDTEYARLRLLSQDKLNDLKAPVEIIGVGQNTLDDLCETLQFLRQNGVAAHGSYMAHMINPDVKSAINAAGLTVFTPGDITGLDDAVLLDAVPHTNSRIACARDAAKFFSLPEGQRFENDVFSGSSFAVVVMNAGFAVDGVQVPYTAAEAAEHGRALGALLPPGTGLLIAHGGPRNLADEKATGVDLMTLFAESYQDAQSERGALPAVVQSRFEPNMPYNIVKASYILAAAPNCAAYICNAEGYGTMDGAAMHVDNTRTLLGMIPYNAVMSDVTGQRQANLVKYNKLGITLLPCINGNLTIQRDPAERQTPVVQKDAAVQIAAHLNIIGTAPKPSLSYASQPRGRLKSTG